MFPLLISELPEKLLTVSSFSPYLRDHDSASCASGVYVNFLIDVNEASAFFDRFLECVSQLSKR